MDQETLKDLARRLLTDAETISNLAQGFDEGSAMRKAAETRALILVEVVENYIKPHLS